MITIIHRLINATRHSLEGLRAIFQSEFAFRLEVAIVFLLMPVIYLMDAELSVKCLLLALLWLLLIVEVINSAIETLVDRISLDLHPLSKKAKDMGSAAVFLTVILNLIIWVFILSA